MSQGQVTFAPGQRLGNYELLLEIASGGTATVGIAIYRGAAGFERLVVIKRVHRQLTRDPEFTAMLTDEARLASSIRHPNVVPVIDVLRVDDEVVLVMEYVDSVTLAQLGKDAAKAQRRLPPAVVSRVLVDTLVGLHEAHEAADIRRQPLGIVHRDVSPQNVLVGDDGVARVIDFGIAKARSRIARTRAGIIKGKCAYMAPEQVDGQAVDRRCDVFAAGIVLWESLTGARLFRGDDEFDEMRRVMKAPIPPPSSVAPECGPDVDALLSHALARPVGERFQTALAFARALEHAIPPAPARAVAAEVEALCGTELDYRHMRLAAILGDALEKLSPRSPRHSLATQKTELVPTAHASSQAPSHPATVRLAAVHAAVPVSTLKSAEPANVAPLDPTPASVAGVDADVEVAGLPKRSLAPLAIGVTLLSLLLGAGGAYAWLSRQSPVAPSAPSATPSAAPSTPPPLAPPPTPSALPPAASSTPVRVPPSTRPAPIPSPELKKNPYGP
jgi:tRNA A-37 threonylcarbamoyl transferase component Bud32